MKYLGVMIILFFSISCIAGQYATSFGKNVYWRIYEDSSPSQPTYIQVEGIPLRGACAHQDSEKGDLDLFSNKARRKITFFNHIGGFYVGKRSKNHFK